ncbi:MAG: histidine kinase N-terminal 7TM domain-containing protein [Candidatus Flexifilum sp.]
MEAALAAVLDLINETLAAAIVIIAASLLLYNLSRNLHDRVARTSALVLACVTVTYIGDVFMSLGPGLSATMVAIRFQWIGIAFMPVALIHLSDALLATTGLPSRGRRKRIIRILYVISAVFLAAALFTDHLIHPVPTRSPYFTGPLASTVGGVLFPLYVIYFLISALFAFINVQRARLRCLTRNTRRRMGYLQFALLTPAIGIFPFSVILGPGEEFSLIGLFLVNAANIVVILMLLFLAYPLSFFGSRQPDRVVKLELLRFLLRGPGTGLLALVTVLFTTSATRILGVPGQSFTPFAVVAVVLFWQWMVALSLPWLEKRLVYAGEDIERLQQVQELSDRLLARSDLIQLLEAILAAACDYLRVSSAFIGQFRNGGGESKADVICTVGPIQPSVSDLEQQAAQIQDRLASRTRSNNDSIGRYSPLSWNTFWLTPLFDQRTGNPIGVLGVQARAAEINLTDDEYMMLAVFARRAARTLSDLVLQTDILASLEGLVPQLQITRGNTEQIEFKVGRSNAAIALPPAAIEIEDSPIKAGDQFKEQVWAALRHYWGGPGLNNSRLLELRVVQSALPEHDNNPARALRAVLNEAIESLRPPGERKLTSPEWTLYNILEMRFLKGMKVKEVFPKISLSESDFYRKQTVAIQAVADRLAEMENAAVAAQRTEPREMT